MRALIWLALILGGCDDKARGLCLDRGVLYCADPDDCCNRCQTAQEGASCVHGSTCFFGGRLSGQSASCGNDGLWHLAALDMSVPGESPILDGSSDSN